MFWQLDHRPFPGKIPGSSKNAFNGDNPRIWNAFEIITAGHEFQVRLWYAPSQRKKSDPDGFMTVPDENIVQVGQQGKTERVTVPLEVMASVNSRRIWGQNSNILCVNSNYCEKMLSYYILGARNCKA